jgi:hypothetical protein
VIRTILLTLLLIALGAGLAWSSLRFPAFSYVTGGPRFYAVRVASALLALGVVALLSRRQRPAEPSGNLSETSDETGAPQ